MKLFSGSKPGGETILIRGEVPTKKKSRRTESRFKTQV